MARIFLTAKTKKLEVEGLRQHSKLFLKDMEAEKSNMKMESDWMLSAASAKSFFIEQTLTTFFHSFIPPSFPSYLPSLQDLLPLYFPSEKDRFPRDNNQTGQSKT